MRDLCPPIAATLRAVDTERLSLRHVDWTDLDDLALIFAEPEVWEFPYGRGMTRAETEAFVDRQVTLWSDFGFGGCAARLRADGRLVGIVGLSVPTDVPEVLPAVSVGWRLAATAWGNGYANEAASALLDQAFGAMQLARVWCVTQPDNLRSVRLAQRLGMTLKRDVAAVPHDDVEPVKAAVYAIDRRDWPPARGPERARA